MTTDTAMTTDTVMSTGTAMTTTMGTNTVTIWPWMASPLSPSAVMGRLR